MFWQSIASAPESGAATVANALDYLPLPMQPTPAAIAQDRSTALLDRSKPRELTGKQGTTIRHLGRFHTRSDIQGAD
jgi:hypothetical protein